MVDRNRGKESFGEPLPRCCSLRPILSQPSGVLCPPPSSFSMGLWEERHHPHQTEVRSMAHSKWGTSQWKSPHFKPRGLRVRATSPPSDWGLPDNHANPSGEGRRALGRGTDGTSPLTEQPVSLPICFHCVSQVTDTGGSAFTPCLRDLTCHTQLPGPISHSACLPPLVRSYLVSGLSSQYPPRSKIDKAAGNGRKA